MSKKKIENAEQLRAWIKKWEAKAAAWEAAGEPEYAAAERAQAEQCRRTLASINKPPIPAPPFTGNMNTLGDLLAELENPGTCKPRPALAGVRIKEDGAEEFILKEWTWRHAAGVADLEATCGTDFSDSRSALVAMSHVFAVCFRAVGNDVVKAHAMPLVDVVSEFQRRADTSADTSQKNQQRLPDNMDARDLAHKLERDLPRTGKSQTQIALEFTHGDVKKAKSLLRIIRRYPLLHEAVQAAANRAGN